MNPTQTSTPRCILGSRTGPVTLMLLAEILNDLAEEKLSGLSHDQQFLKRIGMRW